MSIRTAARLTADPPGTLTTHATLKSSTECWGQGIEDLRWGDCGDIVPDAGDGSDSCTFWTHHEFVFDQYMPPTVQKSATWVAPWSVCDP